MCRGRRDRLWCSVAAGLQHPLSLSQRPAFTSTRLPCVTFLWRHLRQPLLTSLSTFQGIHLCRHRRYNDLVDPARRTLLLRTLLLSELATLHFREVLLWHSRSWCIILEEAFKLWWKNPGFGWHQTIRLRGRSIPTPADVLIGRTRRLHSCWRWRIRLIVSPKSVEIHLNFCVWVAKYRPGNCADVSESVPKFLIVLLPGYYRNYLQR